jgi:uncharacterized protein
MSNTDILKEGYEAFGRGDLDGATQNFAEDIRWENPEAPQVPNSGVTEGRDRVKQLFAALGDYWESFSITPDEFIEDGDTVIVLSHAEARTPARRSSCPGFTSGASATAKRPRSRP